MQIAVKNALIGYGLTLVAGLPLPPIITQGILRTQTYIEKIIPSHFHWYDARQLHVTLRALLRTRYRVEPPLQVSELPADLNQFTHEIAICVANSTPMMLEIMSPRIMMDGVVQAEVLMKPSADWWTRFKEYPELDDEEMRSVFHLNIGNLSAEIRTIVDTLPVGAKLLSPIGQCVVDSLWMVHYSNRSLNRIVGSIMLNLGKWEPLSSQKLISHLVLGVPANMH